MIHPEDIEQWLTMYNNNMTIEEIALEVHISMTTVGKYLRQHPDYQPRPRTMRESRKKHNPTQQNTNKRPSIKTVTWKGNTRGHRRRGRF